jgi:murein DD-endopeptidase MepM/ murein hydrolase activator NlpD
MPGRVCVVNAFARQLAGSCLSAIALLIASAGLVAATDDYTLPFYDPTVTLSYGVDRDSTLNRQLDWTGQVWYDGADHYGRVYDQHTGSDYPMPLRSDVAAARDGTVIDTEGAYGTAQFGDFGNFVLIEHADGRRTLYYHLASSADGGIAVAVGQAVLAGQRVGRSGCSGKCFGAHLHFELRTWSSTKGRWVPNDPLAERRWTTWPGRVPWLAAYVRENNDGTEVVRQGQTITHWVEFRNSGGRTWRSTGSTGRLVLGTWNPAAHASPFRAIDWTSSWLATLLDAASVSPDGIGRFTFGIKGAPSPGSYVEAFNLSAQDLRWFDYARLGSFSVPIVVSNVTP